MSGRPAARQGDTTSCPKSSHKGTTIETGSPDVLFNGLPAARMGDKTSCGSEIVGQVIPNVLINGKPAVVMGSTGTHGDVVTGGSGDIIIGNNIVFGAGISFGDSLGDSGAVASALAAGVSSLSGTNSKHSTTGLASNESDTDALDEFALYDEEDEEEEETDLKLEQHITLRVGIFFDGTGNNLDNTLSTQQCRQQDLAQYPQEILDDITQMCRTHGYEDTNGDGLFNAFPDSSYGNDLSNVAKLKNVYQNDLVRSFNPDADKVTFPLYIDGIGTLSKAVDKKWGLASGRGATGIASRVRESGMALDENIFKFANQNKHLVIDNIEFDVFGFSRGAAAARHFVNEVLKPEGGAIGTALVNTLPWLNESFIWANSASINFVGLFDTVAGIVDPASGDLDPGNEANPGVNLYLPPDCATKVVHITAAHERRHNFSLNRVHESHFEIQVPGVHSDIGGGYHAVSREKILVDKPRVIYRNDRTAKAGTMTTKQWRDREDALNRLMATGLPGDGVFDKRERSIRSPTGPTRYQPETILYLGIRRKVLGDLSKVSLAIMHHLAVESGVSLETLKAEDKSFPADLRPIADKIIQHAINGSEAKLSEAEMRLLHARYIHMSANWSTIKGILVHRPRESGRAIYLDKPQRGYPQ